MSAINAPVNLLDLTPVQLKGFVKHLGEPASAADRILRYIYREYAADFTEMIDLIPSFQQKLAARASLNTIYSLDEMISTDAQTRKVLFRLADKNTIESTLMFFKNPDTGRERRTVCISCQVGCAVGCRFCATGQQGFSRNLTTAEILNQILFFLRRFRVEMPPAVKGKNRAWLTNVVFMGMGEPLANYDNVCRTIAVLNSPKGMGLGFHQVTLSTSGMVPQIRRIAEENLQFQLAISLHAAEDELRNRLVPVNRKYPLKELITACKEYTGHTGRNIFIEYALFDGINDSIKESEKLVQLLDGLPCSINLIVGNPVPSSDFQPSSRETALLFQKKLINSGIRTMLRVSRGTDIAAGCGQLRSRWLDYPGKSLMI
jgi:23S rRNA (adenine2503-C2)-methyltransferase